MILGIGTDLVELDRISQIGLDRLSNRILTPLEQEMLPVVERRRLEYLAGRFAAKEAVSKATGTGIGQKLSFRDIQIYPNEQGAPQIELSVEALQHIFPGQSIRVHLSISHSLFYATALVVIEQLRIHS